MIEEHILVFGEMDCKIGWGLLGGGRVGLLSVCRGRFGRGTEGGGGKVCCGREMWELSIVRPHGCLAARSVSTQFKTACIITTSITSRTRSLLRFV